MFSSVIVLHSSRVRKHMLNFSALSSSSLRCLRARTRSVFRNSTRLTIVKRTENAVFHESNENVVKNKHVHPTRRALLRPPVHTPLSFVTTLVYLLRDSIANDFHQRCTSRNPSFFGRRHSAIFLGEVNCKRNFSTPKTFLLEIV